MHYKPALVTLFATLVSAAPGTISRRAPGEEYSVSLYSESGAKVGATGSIPIELPGFNLYLHGPGDKLVAQGAYASPERMCDESYGDAAEPTSFNEVGEDIKFYFNSAVDNCNFVNIIFPDGSRCGTQLVEDNPGGTPDYHGMGPCKT